MRACGVLVRFSLHRPSWSAPNATSLVGYAGTLYGRRMKYKRAFTAVAAWSALGLAGSCRTRGTGGESGPLCLGFEALRAEALRRRTGRPPRASVGFRSNSHGPPTPTLWAPPLPRPPSPRRQGQYAPFSLGLCPSARQRCWNASPTGVFTTSPRALRQLGRYASVATAVLDVADTRSAPA